MSNLIQPRINTTPQIITEYPTKDDAIITPTKFVLPQLECSQIYATGDINGTNKLKTWHCSVGESNITTTITSTTSKYGWDNILSDPYNAFSNNSITIPINGVYRVHSRVTANVSGSITMFTIFLMKGAASISESDSFLSNQVRCGASLEYIAPFIAGDVISIYAKTISGSVDDYTSSNITGTFNITLISI